MKLLDGNILAQAHRCLGSGLERIPPGGDPSEDYRDPSPLKVAMEFVYRFRNHEAVSIVAPGASHWEIFRKLCSKAEVRGNLVPDAYHAALAIQTGCEWVSLDRGFSRYPGLRWIHPLDE